MSKYYILSAVVLSIFFGKLCTASDLVTIDFSGNFIASACQIDSSSVSQNIDLGQNIDVSTLQSPGSGSQWVAFGIKLVNCPAGTSFATIQFHGESDNSNPEDLYMNSGTAKNVAVELQGTGGQLFGNGKSYTASISSNSVVYNLRTRAYSSDGSATAGTINSIVTATFTYQ